MRSARTAARRNKAKIWNTVADLLARSRRSRTIINLGLLQRESQSGSLLVVPGKVLGSGLIDHEIIVGAFKFSKAAKTKIEKAGGKCFSINELVNLHPQGSRVKILG